MQLVLTVSGVSPMPKIGEKFEMPSSSFDFSPNKRLVFLPLVMAALSAGLGRTVSSNDL